MTIRTFLISSSLVLCITHAADAANCTAYPYTLQNGTTADASQVMDNFNNVLSCINNGFTNGLTVSGPLASSNVEVGTPTCGTPSGGKLNAQGLLINNAVVPATNVSIARPVNPTGTTSGAGVMMGLGNSFTITPRTSGNVMVSVIGNFTNSSGGTTTDGLLRYGTGTPPNNGGTPAGSMPMSTLGANIYSAGAAVPFSADFVLQGLTVGTYWVVMELYQTGGGTAAITNVTMSAAEL